MNDAPAITLENLPYDIVLRAKHLVSYLLLPEDSTVIDLECETGLMTAAMALLQPRLNFIGSDRNRQIMLRARARFKNIPNLSFETNDITNLRHVEESVDAFVASGILGNIYSRANYDDLRVGETLTQLFKYLKPEGLFVIEDYAMPGPDQFVQIEFPVPIRDNRFFRLYGTPLAQTQGEREIELLLWFSQNARARDTVKGFYLEELTPHVPYTRLFRLPAKWAYEFIIRKTNIRKFKNHIGHQYTCLTEGDFDRLLGRKIGARVLYTAPQRRAHITRTHFDGAFRLYTAEGKPRGHMPTSTMIVAQKTVAGKSLAVQEFRPAQTPVQTLSIQAVRDDKGGESFDVVSRDTPLHDIIPYFLTADGRIKVILRGCVEKGIANVTPRAHRNLDGKRWSGHMVSTATLSAHELEGFDHASAAAVARLMIQKFGLRVQQAVKFETGPKGYPAPSMIDERLETFFVPVQVPDTQTLRIAGPADTLRLRVYDADDILRATGAGFIPNPWLDIQMQDLMRRHGRKVTPWLHEAIPLSYETPPNDQMLIAGKILKQKPKAPEKPVGPMYVVGNKNTKWPCVSGAFRPIRGTTGQITTQRSSFIEQARIDGALRGASAHEMDFARPKDEMMNIAAIMPLTEDLQGNTLAGFEFKELPVPSRFGQTAPMMNLPTLPLPNTITDIDEARAYIAAQFDVEVARVMPMGESFFTFVDMMPQRVFPFAMTRYPRRRNQKLRYRNMKDLIDLTDTDFADSILWKWGLANAMLCHESGQVQGYGNKARHKLDSPAPKIHTATDTRKHHIK